MLAILTAILSASAADPLPLRCRLIDLDLQLTRSIPIFCLLATVPVVWTASGKNKLTLVAG